MSNEISTHTIMITKTELKDLMIFAYSKGKQDEKDIQNSYLDIESKMLVETFKRFDLKIQEIQQ